MTAGLVASALLLAGALLIGPVPAVARCRAHTASRSSGRPGHTTADPLAAASTLDALAVCLTSGMAVPAAARAVAESAPTQLRAILLRAADLLALGADPAVAWAAPTGAQLDEQATALLRLARRSASSGAALADAVAELATQHRQELGNRAEAAAERAGVIIAGPLGLCFLPAFLCLGVVPVVAGLATKVLGAGLI